MILYRCFAWNARVRSDRPDGALWFPRPYQGDGRHDNADLYGCLYLSERPLSCVVEQLARFRGQRLQPALLVRRGRALALAELELPDDTELVDLDDPTVLRRERLRPSQSRDARARGDATAGARALRAAPGGRGRSLVVDVRVAVAERDALRSRGICAAARLGAGARRRRRGDRLRR